MQLIHTISGQTSIVAIACPIAYRNVYSAAVRVVNCANTKPRLPMHLIFSFWYRLCIGPSSWWSYCDDRPLVKQWPIVAVFCLRMISTMGWLLSSCSHPSRHRAHGQELDVGVRVLGTGPEAVHGRLRRHPLHEQCQTVPLPGIISSWLMFMVLLQSL